MFGKKEIETKMLSLTKKYAHLCYWQPWATQKPLQLTRIRIANRMSCKATQKLHDIKGSPIMFIQFEEKAIEKRQGDKSKNREATRNPSELMERLTEARRSAGLDPELNPCMRAPCMIIPRSIV
jgi:hypothetical protein